MNKKILWSIIFFVVAFSGAIFFWKFTRNIPVKEVPKNAGVTSNAKSLQAPKEAIIWKTQTLDNLVTIDLPQSQEGEYSDLFIKKTPEDVEFKPSLKGGKEITTFSYVESIGFSVNYNNGFQPIFNVYKAPKNFQGPLITWIKEAQKNARDPDFPVGSLALIQSMTQRLSVNGEDELASFHMPVPSDSGWYAYTNYSNVYLFSMGNSSAAINGMKEGLWDRMMSTLHTGEFYKISEADFKATLGEVKKEEVFSIPDSVEIASFCPECEERGIDLIEGEYWEFIVSADHRRYAYMAHGEGKDFVVLDGQKQQNAYDAIYHLKFSPDGKLFSYHAFDEAHNETYLVLNGQEISVYPGPEGYPHAANGVSEAYSKDGQIAYAKVTDEEPSKMEIYRNGRLINKIEGELIKLWFSDDGKHLEYVVTHRNPEMGDSYYIDSKLQKNDVEYNEYVEPQNHVKIGDREVRINSWNDSIYVNDAQLVSYEGKNPEVYLSSLVASPTSAEVAYKVWNNEMASSQRVSLNGNDSKEAFNDIKDIKFSEDGKTLSYIGRIGRTIYLVTYNVLSKD